MDPKWAISISFVYTGLFVWAFSQLHRLSFTDCSKSSLSLAFCFQFVCMVDPTQMCPSSVSPLGLFQGITWNIEWLKDGTLEPWIAGVPKLKGEPNLKKMTSDPSLYHALLNLNFFSCSTYFIAKFKFAKLNPYIL